MHEIVSEDDFLSYALDSYIYKESATKSIFLSDLRLIRNFETYISKHNAYPILIHNQLNIIYNLFGQNSSIKLLKYILKNKFNNLKNFI